MALGFALPRWMVRAPRTAPPIVSHVVMVEPNISGLCAFNVRSAISTVERVPRILVPCDIQKSQACWKMFSFIRWPPEWKQYAPQPKAQQCGIQLSQAG